MGGMFWTLFALAQLPMDLIEAVFAQLGAWVNTTLPAGAIRDLAADGIIGGIAGTAVFLPQICLLFFLISLLEDTGYLARAAFVMDRLLCRFGLPGHAFVPLLSSHACALPGIMAARLIPDRRDRLATILVAPLMSCSARLPVYVFLTSMLFVGQPLYAAVAFAGCYLLGALSALVSAAVLRRTLVKGTARPMVLELPSYKVPSFTNALISARDQGFAFLKTAGTIIMAISVVMWWLSAYPTAGAAPEAVALQQRAAATADPAAAQELLAEADSAQARAQQQQSFAGRLGRLAQPVFAPLGYDWQLTVGVLTSFLAREVFVSTMSVLLGGSDDPDLADTGVIARIRGATARRRLAAVHAGHVGQRAGVLRAGDAVHVDAGGDAPGDRLDEVGRHPARLHVGARLRRRADHLSGPARRRHQLRIAMTLDWQTVVVTIVALGAALVIVRRFVPARRRSNAGPARPRLRSRATTARPARRPRAPQRPQRPAMDRGRGRRRRPSSASPTCADRQSAIERGAPALLIWYTFYTNALRVRSCQVGGEPLEARYRLRRRPVDLARRGPAGNPRAQHRRTAVADGRPTWRQDLVSVLHLPGRRDPDHLGPPGAARRRGRLP